jgi:Raf kinase inhibitor-like YbhB/YbcL family protein
MAQHDTPKHSGGSLTIQRVQAHPPRGILLASPALGEAGRIDDRYSAYYDDLVPGLSWSAVLEAQAYALVVEDPDAPMDRPFVHWLLWNIPGTAREIPGGLTRTAYPPELPGAVQGHNTAGLEGWHGTKPPPGHGVHHYHFQLFALNAPITHLSPNAGLEDLTDTLKGLTMASGELIGTYERRDPIGDAPSLGRTGGYGTNAFADTAHETATGRGGLDEDDLDRHAPHSPDGVVRRL